VKVGDFLLIQLFYDYNFKIKFLPTSNISNCTTLVSNIIFT